MGVSKACMYLKLFWVGLPFGADETKPELLPLFLVPSTKLARYLKVDMYLRYVCRKFH